MNWKQEATDRLRQLDRLRHSVRSMGQEVKLLREEMGALQGVDTARVAVRGGGWNDDALVGTLVKLGEMEGVLGRTKCRIREVESALDTLDAEDRLLLEEMYIRKDGEDWFRGSFRPPLPLSNAYEGKVLLPPGEWEVTISFPLYNQLDRLLVGLADGSTLSPAAPYTHAKPVVYYGSSITQGGCASRPGMCYPAIISRMLHCDHINMGFSGSCKAEEAITQYLANLDMSVFVCDYDHNAPDDVYLRQTHEKLYRAVREKQPDLPIIFVTRPDVYMHEEMSVKCRQVILDTYMAALREGDKNVDFINGEQFFTGPMWRDCTVDGSHPTDLGFAFMAEHIGQIVKKWL